MDRVVWLGWVGWGEPIALRIALNGNGFLDTSGMLLLLLVLDACAGSCGLWASALREMAVFYNSPHAHATAIGKSKMLHVQRKTHLRLNETTVICVCLPPHGEKIDVDKESDKDEENKKMNEETVKMSAFNIYIVNSGWANQRTD